MTFVSYAQNYEDVMLWRALKHIEKGFYIDIGAAWPKEHSVTYSFYINGWRGINIEPNQEFFGQLVAKRPNDINLPLAIGEKPDSATMYFFGETGLSTLDKGVAHIHKEKGRECTEKQINVYTLNSIFEKYIPENQEVHFLKIDVEGLEKSVLKGNNWKLFRPWVVLVEATLPLSQSESHHKWENIIISAGYLYAYADGLNRYYVAKEHSELMNSFKYPPNVFDEFILASQQSAEEQTSEANARTQSATTRAQTAETRAQTAETRAQQLTNELHSAYNSRSWRITAPIRKTAGKLRQFKNVIEINKNRAPKNTISHIVIGKTITFIDSNPNFRKSCITLIRKLGLYSAVKDVYYNIYTKTYYLNSGENTSPNDTTLSPHAQRIYNQLNDAIAKHQKEKL